MGAKKIIVFLLIGSISVFVFKNYFRNHGNFLPDANRKLVFSKQREDSEGASSLKRPDAGKAPTVLLKEASEPGPSKQREAALRENPHVTSAENIAARPIDHSKSTVGAQAESSKAKSEELPQVPSIVISPKEAKGGVYALYRAVLWRDPDPDGGRNATNLFSSIGWSTYIENSRKMISSPEFEEKIVPNHETISIINRIYSVFLGRCPKETELATHFEHLVNKEPGQITETVLRKVNAHDIQQIFRGGYSPFLCPEKN